MLNTTMLNILVTFFQRANWTIEIDLGSTIAVMPSGYGSGPAIIDLTSLAETMAEELDQGNGKPPLPDAS
jgi:hypothetical protein